MFYSRVVDCLTCHVSQLVKPFMQADLIPNSTLKLLFFFEPIAVNYLCDRQVT